MTQQIRQLILTDEDKQALQTRYQETNNRRWQERIQCVLLKGQGLTLEAIGEVVPYHINTISEWIRCYAEDGLEGLCVWQYQGSPRRLDAQQQAEVKAEVSQVRYSRVKDIVAWVEQRWQVSYSEDGMRELLHNLGLSYQKGQIVPGKADGEAQALFFEGDF
jgi:transposase